MACTPRLLVDLFVRRRPLVVVGNGEKRDLVADRRLSR
jgi:hypothetical protein